MRELEVDKNFEDYRQAQVGFRRGNELPPILNLLGYWFAEYFTSANPSGTGDWDATFDVTTNDRKIDYILTCGGRLEPQIVGGTDDVARYRIAVFNDGPSYFYTPLVRGDTFGRIQIKVNGELNNYTASAAPTFQIRPGINEIQVSVSEAVERVTIVGRLYDGVQSRWHDMDWMSAWDKR